MNTYNIAWKLAARRGRAAKIKIEAANPDEALAAAKQKLVADGITSEAELTENKVKVWVIL